MNEIFGILLGAAEGAFLQVGVFVGAVLFVFGFINYKTQGKFIETLKKSKKVQPIIGALLGVTPGCGGAIFVMPLYLKGQVSYGTVIAALLATMGDAAFVLITTDIIGYAIVSSVCFTVAIVIGYIVDYLSINDKSALISHPPANTRQVKTNCIPVHRVTHSIGYRVYWILIIIGLVLGITMLCQIDINTQLLIPNLGMIVGIAGTALSIIYTIVQKKYIVNDTYDEEVEKVFSLKHTLIHNAEETSFVILWVFVAYFLYESSIYLLGGESVIESLMMSRALLAVLMGAVIGLIPGCGPQIILATLYSRGLIPFAALLANAISQDGDALFPMLVADRRSSLLATIITTIPAIIVGILWYICTK